MFWINNIISSCCGKRQALSRPERNSSSITLPDLEVEEAKFNINTEGDEYKIEVDPKTDTGIKVKKFINPDVDTPVFPQSEANNKYHKTLSPDFSIIKLIPCFEESAFMSRVTTSCSMGQVDVVQDCIYLKCWMCGKPAIGYCVGCPHKKYCKECYEDEHTSISPIHRFFPYKFTKKS